jgi:hypothetical protein
MVRTVARMARAVTREIVARMARAATRVDAARTVRAVTRVRTVLREATGIRVEEVSPFHRLHLI